MFSGTEIDVRDVQPEKALLPSVSRSFGKVISDNLSQRLNALSPILITESGISIFCRLLQLEKASLPMLVTVSGMVIFVKLLALLNNLSATLVVPSSNVAVVSPLLPNTLQSHSVSYFGIFIVLSDSHSPNAT